MDMDKIAVLIPCYNEEKTIEKVVTDAKKALPDAVVYVYDNNSTDRSVELATKAGAVVRRERKQGKGNVIRRMFREIDAECYICLLYTSNMYCFEEYAAKLKAEYNSFPRKPRLPVHLNLMEGHCAADPAEVPHLVEKNGYFNISWGTLFKWNYTPKVFMELKKELKAEITAQTERFREAFGTEMPLRFDGHQHTQMIPIAVSYTHLDNVCDSGAFPFPDEKMGQSRLAEAACSWNLQHRAVLFGICGVSHKGLSV